MQTTLQTREVNGVIVVDLDGRFDSLAAQSTKTELQSLADAAGQRVLLNMKNVDFIDSSGLGLVVSVFRRLREHNGELAISGPSAQVRTIFELTRLHRIFDIHETESV